MGTWDGPYPELGRFLKWAVSYSELYPTLGFTREFALPARDYRVAASVSGWYV